MVKPTLLRDIHFSFAISYRINLELQGINGIRRICEEVISYSKVCFLYIENHDHRHALLVFFDFKQQLILIKIILTNAGLTKLCITSSYISICSVG